MSRYLKAITAFLTALASWLGTALAENGIEEQEWVGLLGVLVVTLGVFAVPNTQPADKPYDPTQSEREQPHYEA
jgi:4-hydroxybenzoate polyprenyltransferase